MNTCDNGAIMFLERFIDPNQAPFGLWWCQNVIDMDLISVNAVCKPESSPWSDINAWIDWLAQFPYILVAVPPGPAQDEIAGELSARSPVPVMIPSDNAWYGAGSVRELYENVGPAAADKLLLDAEEIPIAGLLNIAEIDTSRRKNAVRVVSGLPKLDKAVGGFSGGALSVWTGKRGEGKSTLLGQILLEAVNQNHVVCAYSGELPKEDFKLALLQQAAGYLNVEQVQDPASDRTIYNVRREVVPWINEWWDGRLYLTDIGRKNAHEEDTILKLFEYANRRYGADVFLVDNIMTAQLREEASLGFWRAQSVFTGRLVDFCKRLNVHVHLVAHPRKTEGKRTLEADDVGGSGDITNRADNVFKVERVTPEEKGCDALVTIMKNREYGARGTIKLDFNEPSRRFFPEGGSPAKLYSWEMKMRNG
ncbi:hypothetical protein D1641_09390 [Colidextribacter sp. OB.20]|uniref:DnaB-like helicase C-terminal domain-containing protein n=1 Tax=Colidextribacter sp. OB.20 TaxID=2304568 RepID=UPI00136862E5|nr:DnaB-like helicase C-terminal domain-containing protein [Colidextribacter sp. OB.20]NBI10223.1 hypothetical protein [Colidextribacter sp. OB.20]